MTSTFNSQLSTNSDVVIRVENLYKEYRLGTISHGTLYRDLQSWWSRVRGKEDPNSIISTVQPSTLNSQLSGENPHFLALQDVSFEVKRGEVLGIIGKNGAGKSTLLKILSEVTSPTKGTVKIKGRVASLLEVGTGFHPELTGRENIYLNGAILGMTRKEIDRKFDEIVDFAEVNKFIDTPVKRYSSGMYVRLAFAVAAHLEPEILIVDEVLAVGDAQFQKKCLGKMGDVAKGGRTVLFVSHNLAAIENLCRRAMLLDKGILIMNDQTNKIIDYYLKEMIPSSIVETTLVDRKDRSGNGVVRFTNFYLEDEEGNRLKSARSGMNLFLVFEFKCSKDTFQKNIDIGFSVNSMNEQLLFVLYSSYLNQTFEQVPHSGKFKCFIPKIPLASGRYRVGGRIIVNGEEADWPAKGIGYLDIESGDFYGTGRKGFEEAPFLITGNWKVME